jgi:hypothetical protein
MTQCLRFSRVSQANQFMLWDVEAEVELMSAISGGWRRPFAVWLEGSDHFTVVLLKAHTLKILSRSRLAAASEAPLKPMHAYARLNRAVRSAVVRHGDSESATSMHAEKLEEEEQMHAAQELAAFAAAGRGGDCIRGWQRACAHLQVRLAGLSLAV